MITSKLRLYFLKTSIFFFQFCSSFPSGPTGDEREHTRPAVPGTGPALWEPQRRPASSEAAGAGAATRTLLSPAVNRSQFRGWPLGTRRACQAGEHRGPLSAARPRPPAASGCEAFLTNAPPQLGRGTLEKTLPRAALARDAPVWPPGARVS